MFSTNRWAEFVSSSPSYWTVQVTLWPFLLLSADRTSSLTTLFPWNAPSCGVSVIFLSATSFPFSIHVIVAGGLLVWDVHCSLISSPSLTAVFLPWFILSGGTVSTMLLHANVSHKRKTMWIGQWYSYPHDGDRTYFTNLNGCQYIYGTNSLTNKLRVSKPLQMVSSEVFPEKINWNKAWKDLPVSSKFWYSI